MARINGPEHDSGDDSDVECNLLILPSDESATADAGLKDEAGQ